jgi:hypothetical protein
MDNDILIFEIGLERYMATIHLAVSISGIVRNGARRVP